MNVKQPKRAAMLLLSIGMLFLLNACAAPRTAQVYVKDGKEYGKVGGAFRGRWWNYYERGLSFSDGEFHKEAIADFSEAIRQRDKDQRMARSYGMHFIDYFPHRELGIAFFETGDLTAARKELELSLSHFPSAKARFYLDRVRKALIEQTLQEAPAPRITVDHPADELWTRDDPLIISGVVEDQNYVAGITIGGARSFWKGLTNGLHLKKCCRSHRDGMKSP